MLTLPARFLRLSPDHPRLDSHAVNIGRFAPRRAAAIRGLVLRLAGKPSIGGRLGSLRNFPPGDVVAPGVCVGELRPHFPDIRGLSFMLTGLGALGLARYPDGAIAQTRDVFEKLRARLKESFFQTADWMRNSPG